MSSEPSGLVSASAPAVDAGGRAHGLSRLVHWGRLAVTEPVLSVLFPPRCVGCGDFESHLCPACRGTLEAVGPDCCPRCGEPGPLALVGGRCGHCMGEEVTYAGARAAFLHRGVARRMVADFKFGGQPVLGLVMAGLARPAFSIYLAFIAPADRILVTWVPCHRVAQRKRGYNQAELLARGLASGGAVASGEALGSGSTSKSDGCSAVSTTCAACTGLVRKVTPTKHQKGLGRSGRQGNLRGAFAFDAAAFSQALSRASSPPSAIALVDDVYTTGATAREVASVLGEGTGLPVYVFTFSRAVSGKTERHD